jgi:hypothetical protein
VKVKRFFRVFSGMNGQRQFARGRLINLVLAGPGLAGAAEVVFVKFDTKMRKWQVTNEIIIH